MQSDWIILIINYFSWKIWELQSKKYIFLVTYSCYILTGTQLMFKHHQPFFIERVIYILKRC